MSDRAREVQADSESGLQFQIQTDLRYQWKSWCFTDYETTRQNDPQNTGFKYWQ